MRSVGGQPQHPTAATGGTTSSGNTLDDVLLKAAKKKKLTAFTPPTPSTIPLLSHDAASTRPPAKKQQPQQPAKPSGAPRAPPPSAGRSKEEPVDDDMLFSSIKEEDRDAAWLEVSQIVKGSGTDDSSTADDWDDVEEIMPASPGHGFAAVASSTGFKGFGTPPKQRSGEVASRSSTEPLRLFLFAADEAHTLDCLRELGLEKRVGLASSLQEADAVLATKLRKSGEHVNIQQAEKTAANAGIPFLVVGRTMSPTSLQAALQPLLDPQAAPAPGTKPRVAKPTAADLQAFRSQAFQGFGRLQQGGGSGR